MHNVVTLAECLYPIGKIFFCGFLAVDGFLVAFSWLVLETEIFTSLLVVFKNYVYITTKRL